MGEDLSKEDAMTRTNSRAKVVYVSISNTDDKLGQRAWSNFCADVETLLVRASTVIHGAWTSASRDPWQNACWCAELWAHKVDELKEALQLIGRRYDQGSIAWAEASFTEFIGPLQGKSAILYYKINKNTT